MNKEQLQRCESFKKRNVIDLNNPAQVVHIKKYVIEKSVTVTHIIDKWIDRDNEYLEIINNDNRSRKMYEIYRNDKELTTIADSLAFARRIMNYANGGTKEYSHVQYGEYEWRDHELQGIIGEFIFYQWHALNSKQDISISPADLFFVSKYKVIKGQNDPGDFTIVKDLIPYVIDVKTSDLRSGRPALNINVSRKYYGDTMSPKLKTPIDYYVSVQQTSDTKYWIAGSVEESKAAKQCNWRHIHKGNKVSSSFFSVHLEDLSDPDYLIN